MRTLVLCVLCILPFSSCPAALTWTSATQEIAPWTQYQEMHGCAIVNGWIYTIGGRIAPGCPPQGTGGASADTFSIYRARILAPGATSAWTTCTAKLPAGSPTAADPDYAFIERAVTSYGGRIYITGGSSNGSDLTPRNAVTYVQPQADGDIAAVTLQPATGNSIARFEHTSVIDPASGILYVIGGGSSTTRSSQIDMAQIRPDGSVGDFSTAGALGVRVGSAPAVIFGGRLYMFGGTQLAALNTVQHSAIQPDGKLSTFLATDAPLPEALFDSVAAVAGGQIYVIGGTTQSNNANTRRTVYRASVAADGTISGWVAETPLPLQPGLRRAPVATDSTGIYIPGGRLNDTAVSRKLVFGSVPGAGVSDWVRYSE